MTDKPKVLVLDDELIVAMALAENLEDAGFDVVGPFSTSEQAESALESNPPDIAFLDVNLGRDRTSFELAHKLRERGIPFAFVTGYSEVKSKSSDFADVRFLSKPVNAKHIADEARRMADNTK